MYLLAIEVESESRPGSLIEFAASRRIAERSERRWCQGDYKCMLIHTRSLPASRMSDRGDDAAAVVTLGSKRVGKSGLAAGPWVEFELDADNRLLRVARDPAGLMTAFFARLPDGVLVSDSVPLLLGHPGISRNVDLAALNEYWFLDFCVAPKTIWKEIRVVPNGHSVRLAVGSQGEPVFEQYYFPGGDVGCEILQAEGAAAELRRVVLATTERALATSSKAHVNLLSGGVDSSAVFAACNLLGRKPDYAVTFKGVGDADESTLAARTAAHFGVPLEVVSSESADLIDDATEVVQIWGQPYAHGSVHAMQAMLARVAPDSVLLTGDGGGEAFLGARTRASRFRHLASVALGCCSVLSQEARIRAYRRIATKSHYTRAAFFGLELVAARSEAEELLRKMPLTVLESLAVIAPPFRSAISKEAVEEELIRVGSLSRLADEALFARALFFYWGPEGVYSKTWRILDAKGIAGDAPLTAPEFTSAVKRIPAAYRGQRKQALRDAFADVLPLEVVNAPKRGLRPLNRELLAKDADKGIAWITNGESEAWSLLFDGAVVADFWRAHRDGQVYRSNLLYKAVIFRAWCDTWKPVIEGRFA